MAWDLVFDDDWAVQAAAMRCRDAAGDTAARMQATEDAIGDGLGRIGEGL